MAGSHSDPEAISFLTRFQKTVKAIGGMSSFPCLHEGEKSGACEMQQEQSCVSSHHSVTVLKTLFVGRVHSFFDLILEKKVKLVQELESRLSFKLQDLGLLVEAAAVEYLAFIRKNLQV